MKIYTKTGDLGETGLIGGLRVLKNHPRVAAYGAVDELNAHLGLAASLMGKTPLRPDIEDIQTHLFSLGSELASPQGKPAGATWEPLTEKEVQNLERKIDAMENKLPTLKNFILPGGTPGAAALHVARTSCRRAERALLTLMKTEKVRSETLIFLNRLSDFLFVLARTTNHMANEKEIPWTPPTG